MKKKTGREFFYIDDDGKKQDMVLHENILSSGDVNTAVSSAEAVMRRQGFTEIEIDRFLGGSKQTAKQQVKGLRRRSDYGSFMRECVEIMSDDGMDEEDAYQYCEMKWIEGDDDVLYRTLGNGQWDEEEHPRDSHGRFSHSGGGDEGDSKTPAADLLAKNYPDDVPLDELKAKLSPEFKAAAAQAETEMKGKTITSRQFLGSDGKYVPERAELHRKIIRELFTPEAIAKATPPLGQKPVLTLSGGRPAAGKTSSLKKEMGDKLENSFYINADEIQEKLPGYKGKYAGLYNAEAQDIALQAEKVARHMGLNILYDATLKSKQPAIERVQNYISAGYDVDGYFVHTTPATAVQRSANRFMSDPEGKGRYLPPEIPYSSRTNESTFDNLIPMLRNWALYDNNGKHPVRIAGNT